MRANSRNVERDRVTGGETFVRVNNRLPQRSWPRIRRRRDNKRLPGHIARSAETGTELRRVAKGVGRRRANEFSCCGNWKGHRKSRIAARVCGYIGGTQILLPFAVPDRTVNRSP